MPNHITNHLQAPAYVLATLKGPKSKVDFEKIIPMPPSLHAVQVNGDDGLVEFLFGRLGPSNKPVAESALDQQLNGLKLDRVLRDLQEGGLTKWDLKRFENFITLLRNYKSFGAASWYDWSIVNWGTKWNAYDAEEEPDGSLRFDTAWSAPHPVIQELSKRFPNDTLEHLWADEDIGSNLGHNTWRGGELIIEHPIKDPIDFALTLKQRDREFYRVNSETGLWEYHDPEDEG